MTNTEPTVSEFQTLLGELQVRFFEEYPEDAGPQFTPGRFPYTYAADCLRQFPLLVPEDVRIPNFWPPMSRGSAAHLETVWADRLGMNRGLLAVALASVFCRREGIKVQASRYLEVMDEIRSGKHDQG